MKKSIARFLLLAFAVVPLVLSASLAAIVPAPKKIRLKDGVFRCRSADLSSVVTFGKDPSIPKEGYRLEVTPESIPDLLSKRWNNNGKWFLMLCLKEKRV